MEDPTPSPALTDYRRTPAGVMPRHLQRWVLIGVSVVMIGIMALAGRSTMPRSASTTPSATAAAVDPNQQRIEEYQRRIEEQAQRLAAEQTALQATKAAAGAALDATASPARTSTRRPADSEQSATGGGVSPERGPRGDRSLFADSVAFTREPHGATASGPAAMPAGTPTALASPVSTVTPPPLPAVPLGGPITITMGGQAATPTLAAPAVVSTPPAHASVSAVTPRTSPEERTYPVPEGTIIETVLTNRLDGTYAGPVNCLVTTAVYAADREHLLIPAGARVLGEARPVTTFGQSRLAVVFHRVLLPNGRRVDLENFHGLNQIGETGLRDQVDRHYAEIFGASLAVGAIAGLAQAQTSVGLDASALDVYRQGAATNLAQSSARILDRFLNLLPTVTIREGHRIKVYLSNDLDLPAYREPLATTGGHP